MSKTYEVQNLASGHSFGFYSGDSADAAVLACLQDAGYSSAASMAAETGRDCNLMAARVVLIPAASYADADDSLQAAADAYAAAHGLVGWDLSPRWEHGSQDSARETIVLNIPDAH